ncbi:hypothetical protein CVT25_008637, partial [Psilocybe cyanescens]
TNSHYTVPLLQYAHEHQIFIICYPAHGTHIYQGLDVVIFSPLKKYLSQERDNWFRSTGQPMDKNNFLQIFSKAYVAALTPKNIKMAFKKTGIHPYDPSVITESMLAPSKDTSYEVHLPVPMKQASEPVQALAKALRDLQLVDSSSSVDTETMTSAAEIRSMETTDVAGPWEVQITCSSNPVLNQSMRNSTPATTSTTPSPSPDSTLQVLANTVNSLKQTNLGHLSTRNSTPATTSTTPSPSPDSTLQVLANTVNSLKQTNLGHLVSHTPAVSSDPMPSHTTCTKK